MNIDVKTIDLIFIAYIGITTIIGYFKGAISEIFSIFELLIILAISIKTYDKIAGILIKSFQFTNFVAYTLAFVIVYFGIYVVLKLIRVLIEKTIFSFKSTQKINKYLGIILGFVKGTFVVMVISTFILLIPKGSKFNININDSLFLSFANIVKPKVMSFLGDKELIEAASEITTINPHEMAKFMEVAVQKPEIQQVIMHPKLQALAYDKEIMKLVENHDIMGLMTNKKFLNLLNDTEIISLLKNIDFEKMFLEFKKGSNENIMPKLNLENLNNEYIK